MTGFGAKQARDGATSAGRPGITVRRLSGLGLVWLLALLAGPTVAVADHSPPPGLEGDGFPDVGFDRPGVHTWTAPSSELGRFVRVTVAAGGGGGGGGIVWASGGGGGSGAVNDV